MFIHFYLFKADKIALFLFIPFKDKMQFMQQSLNIIGGDV
ncbi:hypothetical protein J599_2896 [Acinetobacter baumannii 1598530]|uniref:Uncharacterized protein n=1 Tax=Acinetobacter baumannii (strain 1295743) TaxID=1310613 RepID=A0A009I486_ACIB9|nr:hypothetical protein J512_2327 [Acinetobacter baumannii 1295743]EXB40781.1 hypothetical protein J544_2681 [Acinetobacter baumannii 1461963]EXH43155.1 hypothetical protein J651_2039 [Acinetobacter baumannii 1293320]KCY10358.1 hypothetical protein J599_2896 [Acinetobacter baumannii 1598530]